LAFAAQIAGSENADRHLFEHYFSAGCFPSEDWRRAADYAADRDGTSRERVRVITSHQNRGCFCGLRAPARRLDIEVTRDRRFQRSRRSGAKCCLAVRRTRIPPVVPMVHVEDAGAGDIVEVCRKAVGDFSPATEHMQYAWQSYDMIQRKLWPLFLGILRITRLCLSELSRSIARDKWILVFQVAGMEPVLHPRAAVEP